jgi:hypothetical protein
VRVGRGWIACQHFLDARACALEIVGIQEGAALGQELGGSGACWGALLGRAVDEETEQ